MSCALDGLHRALAEIAAVVDGGSWRLSSSELLESVVALHHGTNKADAVLHHLVHEVDVRGAAIEVGAPHTAGWLRARLHLHPGAAKRVVATAKALHGDPHGSLVRHSGEEAPDGHAVAEDVADTDVAADNVAPDDVAAEHTAGRSLLRAALGRGTISAEHAAVAAQSLAELSGSVSADVVTEAEEFLAEQATLVDPRSLAQLAKHLRHVLDPDGEDDLAERERRAVARRVLELKDKRDGSADVRGHLDPELAASLRAALGPLARPRPSAGGERDLRTIGQRNADALADLIRIAASGDGMPVQHGARPTVSVHISLQALMNLPGHPCGQLDWSGPISAATARRLSCDAMVVPVVLGSRSEPLDVGRASYVVTQAIWRALVARDGGCAFAGCDRPPEWTEAHHRTHWADGGETSVANCCLLCDHHHRQVHHHGWTPLLIDDVIHVVPPPWVDPSRTPRPNTNPGRLGALRRLPRLGRPGRRRQPPAPRPVSSRPPDPPLPPPPRRYDPPSAPPPRGCDPPSPPPPRRCDPPSPPPAPPGPGADDPG